MKLELKQNKNAYVLQITGQIGDREFLVLRAGIIKLFKDGKNRIVLHFTDTKEMKPDLIRDLVAINITASEMSGQLGMVIQDKAFREKVLTFSNPQNIICVDKVDDAISQIDAKTSGDREDADPGTPPSPLDEELKKAKAEIEKLKEEVAGLKEKLKSKETGELATLKKDLATLKGENKVLKDKVTILITERKLPTDASAMMEKIKRLEQQVENFVAGQKAEKPPA